MTAINDRYEDPRLIQDLFKKEIDEAAQGKKFSAKEIAILFSIFFIGAAFITAGSYFLSRDISQIRVTAQEVVAGITIGIGGIATGVVTPILFVIIRRRHRKASADHLKLDNLQVHQNRVADKLESILRQQVIELPTKRQFVNKVKNAFSKYKTLDSSTEPSWKLALRMIKRMNSFQVGEHLKYVQKKIDKNDPGHWKTLRTLLLSHASTEDVKIYLRDKSISAEDRYFIYTEQLTKELQEEERVQVLSRIEQDIVDGLHNQDYEECCRSYVNSLSAEHKVEHYASKAAQLLYFPEVVLPQLRKLITQQEVKSKPYLMDKLAAAAHGFRSSTEEGEFLASQYSQLLLEILPFLTPCFVPKQQWQAGGCYYGMNHPLLKSEAQYKQLVALDEEERIEFFTSSSPERQQEFIREHFVRNVSKFLTMGENFKNEVYKVLKPTELFILLDQLDPHTQKAEIERIAFYQGGLTVEDESVTLVLTSSPSLSPARALFAGWLANKRLTEQNPYTLSRLAAFCSHISLDSNRDLFLQGAKNKCVVARLHRDKFKTMQVGAWVGKRVRKNKKLEQPPLKLTLIDGSIVTEEEPIKRYFKNKLGLSVN